MKIAKTKSTTLFGAMIVAAFLFVSITIGVVARTASANASDSQDSRTGRLVTIHDRGEQKVILTSAATVGDALKEAGVTVDKNDAVEPDVSQKLVASQYQVNIYRARPVLVVDGAIREKVVTPHQTAIQIAADAGITLYPEDVTSLAQSTDIVADGAGLVLTITPATPLTLVLYGSITPLRTQAKTVGELLKNEGITLGKNDSLSASDNTPITDGMTIQLWHNGNQTVNVQEVIPFNTQTIDDADQPVGYSAVTTAGVNGSKTVTYEIDMENGQEVSRTQIQSVVISQPSTQVVTKGIKGAYTTPTENETIIWNYLINDGFSREQTAGIMGNLEQEHQFQTSGDGLVQWTGSRKALLLSRYADPYSVYSQLDFMMYELNGSYGSALSSLRATTDVETAETVFQNKYEGCGNCMQSLRLSYAYDILATF
jgi:uncharacterized protein YabE (DUF348 family)